MLKTLNTSCSISTSGPGKFLLGVFLSLTIIRKLVTARGGRRGGSFTPQNYQPCQHTHSLSSFSSAKLSVKDDPQQRINTNLPKTRQNVLKPFRAATSLRLSTSPKQLRSRTENLMLSPDSPSCRHTRHKLACPPSSSSPLCSTLFLAETTLCYGSR